MRTRNLLVLLALAAAVSGIGWAYLQADSAGGNMTRAANEFLDSLNDEQRAAAVLADFDSPQRLEWHFIPKETRKGLQMAEMDKSQQRAAAALLRAGLSESGYYKADKIMELEHILHMLETERDSRRWAREPLRYYVTVFGDPGDDQRWGLSFEGHHLSLNFVIDSGEIVSSTPSFYGANPAVVKNEVEGGLPVGTRILAREEELAFELIHSMSDEQRTKAVIDSEAPREIRAAGEPQPPQTKPVGIGVPELTRQQLGTLKELVTVYASNMASAIRKQRLEAIAESGPENVHFAWAGATEPGIGHYYRIQGPSFLIEFVNTQPDPAGNPANHIHCVWRDMKGDLGVPIGG